jgi:hypothetical protein
MTILRLATYGIALREEAQRWFVRCGVELIWFQQLRRLKTKSGQEVFWPAFGIKMVMQFPSTLTPDEGLILLFLGLLTLLACLGFAVWLVVS